MLPRPPLDTGRNTVEPSSSEWNAGPDTDPFTYIIKGYAAHNYTPFEMPAITHVIDNLWHGGFVHGLNLKNRFDVVVSLYPWERYGTQGRLVAYRMYDGNDVDVPTLNRATDTVISALNEGKKVLVHCQAGLNRSSLVVGNVLVNWAGMHPEDAITLMRAKRSPAVLCNPTFARYLLELRKEDNDK